MAKIEGFRIKNFGSLKECYIGETMESTEK